MKDVFLATYLFFLDYLFEKYMLIPFVYSKRCYCDYEMLETLHVHKTLENSFKFRSMKSKFVAECLAKLL